MRIGNGMCSLNDWYHVSEQDAIATTKRVAQELEQKYQLLEIAAEKKRLKEENQQLAAQLGSTAPPIPTRAQIAMLLEVS